MVQQPEILVHISAPGRVVDDARYRKEALGFLNFNAVARHAVLASDPKERGSRTEAFEAQPATHAEEQLLSQEREQTALQISGTKDRANHKRRFLEADKTSKTPGFLKPPLLQGTTPIAFLPRLKPTKWPFVHIERTPAVERPRTAPTSSSSSQETPSLRRTQSDSWEPPPSVVPDSQPSQQCLKRGIFSCSPSPTHRGSSPCKKRRRQDFPPTSDAARSSYNSPRTVAWEARLEVAASFPSSPPASIFSLRPTSSASSITRFPLEIHPPRPPVGTAQFKTHLTLSLTTVSAQLAKHFEPISHVRPLEPLERGHWLLSTAGFPSEIKERFWDFLLSFLNEGRAGWGVWTIRDGETVRVYGWGEIVREVWCVLFLASHRKISEAGARWVDSRGEVVVQMS